MRAAVASRTDCSIHLPCDRPIGLPASSTAYSMKCTTRAIAGHSSVAHSYYSQALENTEPQYK